MHRNALAGSSHSHPRQDDPESMVLRQRSIQSPHGPITYHWLTLMILAALSNSESPGLRKIKVSNFYWLFKPTGFSIRECQPQIKWGRAGGAPGLARQGWDERLEQVRAPAPHSGTAPLVPRGRGFGLCYAREIQAHGFGFCRARSGFGALGGPGPAQ